MKTLQRIIFLLAVLTCAIQPTHAYEYFTIYFTDGTKSEPFYATDVDSIRYSKLDVDSIEYANWQVQEIWTVDSVYRYPLTTIDNLSFTDVDENKVAEDLERVNTVLLPVFSECKSTIDLSNCLDIIRKTEGVEKAWTDNNTLFVKIRDYGTMTFSYPAELRSAKLTLSNDKRVMSPLRAQSNLNASNINIGKACIYNQTANNDIFEDAKEVVKEVREMYGKMGITLISFSYLPPSFFDKEIFNYDQVFLITHGEYDSDSDLHWIYTSEEIHKVKAGVEDLGDFMDVCKKFFSKYPLQSARKVAIGSQIEVRDGIKYVVYYSKISDEFILSSANKFQNPNAMVFNVACQSLRGNHKFGKAFTEGKGAGCYIGYNDNNTMGHRGGQDFLRNLLNGRSVESAYKNINSENKSEYFYVVLNTYNGEKYYKSNNESYENGEKWYEFYIEDGIEYDGFNTSIDWVSKINNYFINTPETLDPEISTNSETQSYKLKGQIKIPAPTYTDGITGYIEYSDNIEMNNSELCNTEGDYDSNTLYASFETTLSEEDLKPNTTYYYRAVINDGIYDNYGEIKQFTTGGDAVAYAVLAGDSLTFYYDNQKEKHYIAYGYYVFDILDSYTDDNLPQWTAYSWKTLNVVFTPSFMNFKPTSTAYWFHNGVKMKDIKNINYLNTSNVTNMRAMFFGCSSLQSLDVSSFNTSNVTDMGSMFFGCSSLQSLNVSSFNTSNVTDMGSMFTGCSSLTSINVSGFNTSNVTDMGSMFQSCKSLQSLDMSSFNTSNVTNMRSMFTGCSSLTSINVSGFNTSNVTNMWGMFAGCSTLTSLDLGSFNTEKVTTMYRMFNNSSSLTSINLSSFNTKNVTTMYGMFWNCLSLTNLDLQDFNTIGVIDMGHMFDGCESLAYLDLSSFNTSNVTNMMFMFQNCKSLVKLDLSSFEISSKLAPSTGDMFKKCSALQTIYAGNWYEYDLSLAVDFSDCENLRGEKGTKIWANVYGYDSNGDELYYICPTDARAAHIDGGMDNPGLFTAK